MSKDYDIPEDSLVILVGVAGSGKSTIAEKFTKSKDAIISSDRIREELFGNEDEQSNPKLVFEEFHKRIEDRLKDGKIAIADATSLKGFARQNLYHLATKYNRPIRVIIMNVPLELALKQNSERERKVQDDVIIKMHKTMEREYYNIEKEISTMPNAKVCDVVYIDENRDMGKTTNSSINKDIEQDGSR